MIYHPRTPREAVNLRKEHADTAVYLAGGTDDLRLGGAAEGKDLIDITGFDFNTISEKDGKVYINGKPETSYTFKYDYYWMMGDNRHNSADSRSWGFVPEDHIVGKPILVWLSLDKDRSLFDGGIRWNRLFRWVHPD